MSFKILLLEDSDSDISTFRSTIERMNDSVDKNIYEIDIAKNIKEAKEKLKNAIYNGCVVDIKLDHEDGNTFINSIMEDYRMPVIVFTGTPDVETEVQCFVKGEKTPEDVIHELEDENKTGMFRVLGGKGEIEKQLTKVFWDVLYPHMSIWKKYSEDNLETEKILLRYTIAHLLELLDEDGPIYCTEEMYICGDIKNHIRTGSIFENKEDKVNYMLLSPPCDLATRSDLNRSMNTTSVLLCEIEPIDWRTEKKGHIESIIKNNKGNHYHWLPDNELYKGGRLNFRKVVTCDPQELDTKYVFINVKIQETFARSILQRFSAYYARQGQPDFDFKHEADLRKNKN